MRKVRRILCLAGVFAISITACSREPNMTDPNIDPNATNIRLHNASEFDFKNVEVNTSVNTVMFGDIKNGAKTDYQQFEIAYRYAFIRLFIDGAEFIIQPVDYVGETPLGPGVFTYVLDVVDFKNRALNITAVEE